MPNIVGMFINSSNHYFLIIASSKVANTFLLRSDSNKVNRSWIIIIEKNLNKILIIIRFWNRDAVLWFIIVEKLISNLSKAFQHFNRLKVISIETLIIYVISNLIRNSDKNLIEYYAGRIFFYQTNYKSTIYDP